MRSTIKVVAVLASAALTTGGLAAATTTSATGADDASSKAAAKSYNFISSAYGTRVFNKNNKLVDSGRTAWSLVACTSDTGKKQTDKLVSAELPGDQVSIGGVRTVSRSVKTKNGVKSLATTRVGAIKLKTGLGSLTINGLKGVSESSNKNGKFGQRGTVDIADIKGSLLGLPGVKLPSNPDNIDPDREYNILGLGTIRFLDTKGGANGKRAWNNSVALEIKVKAGGPLKGQTIRVGSARTKLTNVAKNGATRGYGQAARGSALNNLVKTGRIGHQPLDCLGTNGKWKKNSVAGLDAGQLGINAASGEVRGVNKPGKPVVAHTRSRIAGVKLTRSLRIGAIRSHAKVIRNGGKYKKSSGASVLNVRAGGQNWTKRINRAINNQKSITIPGIAKITPNVVKKTKKTVTVTALRIRLLDVAKPLRTTIHLANSQAKVR